MYACEIRFVIPMLIAIVIAAEFIENQTIVVAIGMITLMANYFEKKDQITNVGEGDEDGIR